MPQGARTGYLPSGHRGKIMEVAAAGRRPLVVFVVNHVAFFESHRLPIAIEATRRGWRVLLLTGQGASREMELAAEDSVDRKGIPREKLAFGASRLNVVREAWGFLSLWWRLWGLAPDVVHCASPMGLLYGGIAARFARVPSLVLAVSGMGYAFTEGNGRGFGRSVVRYIYSSLIRLACGHPNKRVIVQNVEDERWILERRLASTAEVVLIPGSGVDLDVYSPPTAAGREKLIVLPSRLLVDKGVLEFVDAARLLAPLLPDWRFVLAGAAGYRNPTSISRQTVEDWVSEGVIEWMGYVQDMPRLLRRASVVCLPSYREGLPKVLLEAAAAGCAVVTTDATGCREAIIDGETGDLVPVGDASALADKLRALILDSSRRARYGQSGRLLAERRFGLAAVLHGIFGVYNSLEATRRKH